MKNKLQGSAFLLLTTIIWGCGFVAQSVGMDYIGPFTFQAVRCAIGFFGLLPIIFLFDLKHKTADRYFKQFFDKKLMRAGVFCGVPLFLAISLQQLALVNTLPGKAAFLTSLYIVFTPIIGLFFRRKVSIMVPISVVLALIGLYCMCFVEVTSVQWSDLVLIASAVCFALQISMVDKFAVGIDGLRLNALQALICSSLSAVFMLFFETPNLNAIRGALIPLVYSGFLSMGIGYTLQIIGQQKIDATPAALIMSLEAVFASIGGWLYLHEFMTGWELIGCLIMFSAVILSQIPIPNKKHKKSRC